MSKKPNFGPQMSVTIREASTGKKHTNPKSSLKLQHIKNLALWATRDAPIPSLGAFFSHHFASSSEALATPVDPSLFTCQRCESILHPGYNCTIRIEKNKKIPRKKGKKAHSYPQNNIVYTCHFCKHRNVKRGTPRISTKDPDKGKKGILVKDNCAEISKGTMGIVVKDEQTTPLTFLESKMKKRNRSGAKKKVGSDLNAENSVNSSNKRRRKSWTSLKEIAESSDNRRRLMNITVPFSME